jgi:WD40 repeat protein
MRLASVLTERLAFSGQQGIIVVKELDSNETIEFDNDQKILYLDFSNDNKTIAFANYEDNIIKTWNIETDTIATIGRHPYTVSSIVFNSDGTKLITSTANDGKIHIWDVSRRIQMNSFTTDHKDELSSIEFISSENMIASTGGDGSIKLWNFEGELIKPSMSSFNRGVYQISFTKDSSHNLILATANEDATVRLWRVHERYDSGAEPTIDKLESYGCNFLQFYFDFHQEKMAEYSICAD